MVVRSQIKYSSFITTVIVYVLDSASEVTETFEAVSDLPESSLSWTQSQGNLFISSRRYLYNKY